MTEEGLLVVVLELVNSTIRATQVESVLNPLLKKIGIQIFFKKDLLQQDRYSDP